MRRKIGLKIRRKLRRNAAEAVLVLIVVGLSSLFLVSYLYPSSLAPQFTQGVVAGTPLAVAFATFYVSVSIVRDRRARQMAERVYTPLLNEVKTWSDPGSQGFIEWTRLNKEAPYWIKRVPKDITTIFGKAEPLFADQ